MLHILCGFLSSLGWRMKPASGPSPAPNHFIQFLQIISQIRPCYLSLTFTVLQIFLGCFLGQGSYLPSFPRRKGVRSKHFSHNIHIWGQKGSAGRTVGSQQHHTMLVLSAEQKRIQLQQCGAQHAFGQVIDLGMGFSATCRNQQIDANLVFFLKPPSLFQGNV